MGGAAGDAVIVVPHQLDPFSPPRLRGDQANDFRHPPEGKRMPSDGEFGAHIHASRHSSSPCRTFSYEGGASVSDFADHI